MASIDELIQHAYLATVVPDGWKRLLTSVQERIDAASVTLTFLDVSGPKNFVQAAVGIPPEAIALYHQRYAASDPIPQRAQLLGLVRTGAVNLIQEMITE